MNLHAFYCDHKKCRKTVYETPEYLTAKDWEWLRRFVEAAVTMQDSQLWQFLYPHDKAQWDQTEAFFNRMIGWPEGFVYCRALTYFIGSGYRMIIVSELPKLLLVLLQRAEKGRK